MINIIDFCGVEDTRRHINSPFIVKDKIVATNGHVLIASPNDHKNEYIQCPEGFNAARVINIIDAAQEWAKVDKIILPEMIGCVTCLGGGKAKKTECEECEGDGTVDAETDYSTYYDLTCASCDGVGYLNYTETDDICPDCNGSGKVYEPYACVEILGINVQAKYLRLIINEENLEFSANTDSGMLIFKCIGYTGAIMQCRA